jgi:hypothetical protein
LEPSLTTVHQGFEVTYEITKETQTGIEVKYLHVCNGVMAGRLIESKPITLFLELKEGRDFENYELPLVLLNHQLQNSHHYYLPIWPVSAVKLLFLNLSKIRNLLI